MKMARFVPVCLGLISLFATPVLFGAQADIAFPLHTEGRWIVDAAGVRVKLRSVNWYGAEEQDHVVAGLEIDTLQHIAHRIKTMGFNSVRLPWSNELYETNPIVPDYTVAANPNLKGKRAMQVFDATVRALADGGLLIILDNHTSNGDWCCSTTDGNTLWYNTDYPESAWIADWQGMAKRYANVPQVIGADLRNELRGSATWGGSPVTDWHAAAERGGNAVLSVNPNLLIIVEGINYALDLTGVASLPVELSIPKHLVYSAHDYPWDHNGVSSETVLFQQLDNAWGYIITPRQPYTAPVWVGEFGNCHTSSSCITGFWLSAFRDYLDQRDLDWSWWAVNGTEARGTSRTFGAEETYGILNPYWDAPAITSELNTPTSTNLLGILQTVMQPAQGPGVDAATEPPLVAMVTPLPGSLYSAGSTVHLTADAAVRKGTISQVQFSANGQVIGTVTAPPFTFDWQNVAPGNYKISAVVTANSGLTATSNRVSISVIDYTARNVAYGDSISMDFGDYNVTPMSPSDVAGVVPRANWNASYGNSGFLPNLVNQQGTATSAAVSWTSPNMWYSGIPDQAGDFRMMKGYQDTSNNVPAQIEVTGIPFAAYDVYVYFDGGNGSAAREGNYQVMPTSSFGRKGRTGCDAQNPAVITGLDAPNSDFSGTFAQASGGSAGNYVLFPNCTGDTFTLLAVHGASSDNTYRAPVNGIQIVAVPTAQP
jgi:endoglucanase